MVATTAQKEFQRVRKATVLKDSTGDALRIGGYCPDKKRRNSNNFSASRFSAAEMPEMIDLRPFMTSVENQYDSNSCTANAMAGAYEYLENRLYGQATDVSRLFIYYNARALDGSTHEDEGTYLANCVKVVRKYGACSEEIWPFQLGQIKAKPPKAAYKDGVRFRIEDAASVAVDLDTMRACLAEGYPFVFGLQLFESFTGSGGNGGLVAMPDPENETHNGGHAMLCVGYSDSDQVFVVRNSWGPEWGDGGYCYVPYAYMADPVMTADCWVIRQVSDREVDFSRDIRKPKASLFSPERSEMVRSLRIPGATQTPSGIALYNESYSVEYVEQLVYLYDSAEYVNVSEVEDLESLYYLDYEEEYEEEYDYSIEGYEESSEEEDDSAEASYEESEEDEEESSEEEDDSAEASYEEDEESEESFEEEDDSAEASYEEDEESEEDEEGSSEEGDDSAEASYEEDEEESSEEEDDSAEASYEESSEEEDDSAEASYEEDEGGADEGGGDAGGGDEE
jgi:Papain family cysteine protease